MATPFAAFETATATAAVAAFANATATVGGTAVDGVFDNAYAGAFGGLVPDTDPVFTGLSSDLASAHVGDTVRIGATTFSIAALEPDGLGLVVLRLKALFSSAWSDGFSAGFGA